jgi:hypothetical protein
VGPGGNGGPPQPTYLSKTISQMGFSDTKLALVTEKVRNLTVKDLQDLASRFLGQPVTNDIVLGLQAVDLKGIEDLFVDQRARALQLIATSAGPGGPVVEAPGGNACCSCTPCCSCCAAAEVNPFNE